MIANGRTEGRFITAPQRRKIFAASKELGLTRAALYFLLHQVTGKSGIRSLTQDDAARLIDELVARGASGLGRQPAPPQQPAPTGQDPPVPRPPAVPARPGGPPAKPPGTLTRLATDEQLGAIEDVLQQLNLSWEASEFLAIVRAAGIRRGIKTDEEASKVLAALRAIQDRQEAGPGGATGGEGHGDMPARGA